MLFFDKIVELVLFQVKLLYVDDINMEDDIKIKINKQL